MAERVGPVYLDNAATTPVDPRVRERMLEWLDADSGFGNAASTHRYGRRAALAVEEARAEVAALINAAPEELIWTSGATEANNLAVLGVARFYGPTRGRHVVTVRTEHKSVLAPCARLAAEGFAVTQLEVERDGSLDLERLAAALRPDTALVSVMYVNNETGVTHPIEEIARVVKATGILLHVDAAQAAGRLPIDVDALGVDLLSLSAHKLYGPKGIGALYLRRHPRIRVQPLLWGGEQESGVRPGTVPVHQAVGMGEAYRLARLEGAQDVARLRALRQRLWDGLSAIGGVLRNGREDGSPHILNVAFVGVHGQALAAELDGLAASTTSACSSASGAASHVLRAMGVPEQLAHASLRLSLGRFSTEQDVDLAVQMLKAGVERLRALSPVWQGYLAGRSLEELYGNGAAAHG